MAQLLCARLILVQLWRQTRSHRVFNASLLGLLTVGITAATLGHSLVEGVLSAPLGFRNEDELVVVSYDAYPTGKPLITPLPNGLLLSWRDRLAQLAELAALKDYRDAQAQVDYVSVAGVKRLRANIVTPNFFAVLGAQAVVGRLFEPRDDATTPTIVLSHAMWRTLFAADPNVVGRYINIGSGFEQRQPRPHLVIGVLSEQYRIQYPVEADVWLVRPWRYIEAEDTRAYGYLAVARMTTGTSAHQLLNALDYISRDQNDERLHSVRSSRGGKVIARPLREWLVGDQSWPLISIGALTGLLMAMTCTLGAGALMASIADRGREIAIREALGATPRRITQQFVAEATALSLVASTIAIFAAAALVGPVKYALPRELPRAQEFTIRPPSVVAAVLLVTAVLILSGWAASRIQVNGPLTRRLAGARNSGNLDGWYQRLFLGLQCAFGSALLVIAGVLTVSLWRLGHVPLGFEVHGLTTVEIRVLDQRRLDPDFIRTLGQELANELRRVPGVEQVALSSAVPIRNLPWLWTVSLAPPSTRRFAVNGHEVDSEYFDILRLALISGRSFSPSDNAASPRVAIVSQSFAFSAFPGVDPIGQAFDFNGVRWSIVGVANDVRDGSIRNKPTKTVYLPRSQQPGEFICLLIRLMPGSYISPHTLDNAVRRVDPTIPVARVSTGADAVSESIAFDRFYGTIAMSIGFGELLVVVAGVTAASSRSVYQRRRHLAICAFLGASQSRLVAYLLRDALGPVAVGSAVGLFAGWAAATASLSDFLFATSINEPWIYPAVMAVQCITTLVASAPIAINATGEMPARLLYSVQ